MSRRVNFMASMGKTIFIIGIIMTLLGLVIILGSKLGFGKLPGDLFFKRNNVTIYFPLATSVIISIMLSIVLNIFFRK